MNSTLELLDGILTRLPVTPAQGTRLQPIRLAIASDEAIAAARMGSRTLLESLGFSRGEQIVISAMISELVRNIAQSPEGGNIAVSPVRDGARTGIFVLATDRGPRIPSGEHALADSSPQSLGACLRGIRQLSDAFKVEAGPHASTVVTFTKWKLETAPLFLFQGKRVSPAAAWDGGAAIAA